MNRLILVGFFLFSASIVCRLYAQNYDGWVRGEVLFDDNSQAMVDMRFNTQLEEGLLQIRKGDGISSLSPEKVKSFAYIDDYNATIRNFVSVPIYSDYFQYTKKYFLEVIFEGDNLVLMRRAFSYALSLKIKKPMNFSNYEVLYLYDKEDQELFIYTIDTTWGPKANKKVLHQLLGKNKDAVKNYIKENKLFYTRVEDLVRIIEYYDDLNQS